MKGVCGGLGPWPSSVRASSPSLRRSERKCISYSSQRCAPHRFRDECIERHYSWRGTTSDFCLLPLTSFPEVEVHFRCLTRAGGALEVRLRFEAAHAGDEAGGEGAHGDVEGPGLPVVAHAF